MIFIDSRWILQAYRRFYYHLTGEISFITLSVRKTQGIYHLRKCYNPPKPKLFFFFFFYRFTDPKVLLGNQQELVQFIESGDLNMSILNSYSVNDLNCFMKKLGVGKSDLRR